MIKRITAGFLALVLLMSLCACAPSPSQPTAQGTAEELDALLEDIAAIPVATMGVSMIATARAVELLDWCSVTAVTAEEAALTVKAYYDALDTAAQEMFTEQLSLVTRACESLANDDNRSLRLESAGLDKTLTWDADAFAFAAVIGNAL